MISQMNLVQNAARMAMDHRAARPLKRPVAVASSLGLILGAAVVCALVIAALAYGVATWPEQPGIIVGD